MGKLIRMGMQIAAPSQSSARDMALEAAMAKYE